MTDAKIPVNVYRDLLAPTPVTVFPPSVFDEEFLANVHSLNTAKAEMFREARGGVDSWTFTFTHGEGEEAHSHELTVDYLPVPLTPEEAVIATRPLHGVEPENDLEATALGQAYHQHALYLAEFVRAAHRIEGHPTTLCQATQLLELWEATFQVLAALPDTDEAAATKEYLQSAVQETTASFVVAAHNGLSDMISAAEAGN